MKDIIKNSSITFRYHIIKSFKNGLQLLFR